MCVKRFVSSYSFLNYEVPLKIKYFSLNFVIVGSENCFSLPLVLMPIAQIIDFFLKLIDESGSAHH